MLCEELMDFADCHEELKKHREENIKIDCRREA